jgi:hypothetical protein
VKRPRLRVVVYLTPVLLIAAMGVVAVLGGECGGGTGDFLDEDPTCNAGGSIAWVLLFLLALAVLVVVVLVLTDLGRLIYRRAQGSSHE